MYVLSDSFQTAQTDARWKTWYPTENICKQAVSLYLSPPSSNAQDMPNAGKKSWNDGVKGIFLLGSSVYGVQ